MELSIECCQSFNKIRHQFDWFSFEDEKGVTFRIMPHLKASDTRTKIRINHCPICGKNIRSIELR